MLCFSYPSFLPVGKMESGKGFKAYHHTLNNTLLTGLTEWVFPQANYPTFHISEQVASLLEGKKKKSPPKNPSIFILNQICPLLFNLQSQTNIILTDNSNLLSVSFYSSNPNLLLFLSCELSFQSLHLSVQFSLVQLLSRVWFFATPWIAALQASLSIANSRSLLTLMSVE